MDVSDGPVDKKVRGLEVRRRKLKWGRVSHAFHEIVK